MRTPGKRTGDKNGGQAGRLPKMKARSLRIGCGDLAARMRRNGAGRPALRIRLAGQNVLKSSFQASLKCRPAALASDILELLSVFFARQRSGHFFTADIV
jgi:hypothetical protein